MPTNRKPRRPAKRPAQITDQIVEAFRRAELLAREHERCNPRCDRCGDAIEAAMVVNRLLAVPITDFGPNEDLRHPLRRMLLAAVREAVKDTPT